MTDIKKLSDAKIGEKVIVKEVLNDDHLHRRLLDLGIIKGTEIEVLGKSPCGDPYAYLIRGAVIALRKEYSSFIIVNSQGG